ncbi:MAG: hypothetical protein GY832_15860 [Chloroflexi bacterium]|nr:hypothetical protein [Chloroflexota bacterium]
MYTKQLNLLGLVICILLVATSCRTPSKQANQQSTAPSNIDCQVFYRASTGASLSEGSLVALTPNGGLEVATFDELEFSAHYSGDQFEGPSVSISVIAPDTGEQIVRQLYQIDQAKGLVNQFVGGHGFTGLVYVYRPGSTAEMQYFCQVR